MPLLKVQTSGTTVYLVDVEGQRFKRHKGETSTSGPMWRDGEWNEYHNEPTIEVGKSMKFWLTQPLGAWQMTSAVTVIEKLESEPNE